MAVLPPGGPVATRPFRPTSDCEDGVRDGDAVFSSQLFFGLPLRRLPWFQRPSGDVAAAAVHRAVSFGSATPKARLLLKPARQRPQQLRPASCPVTWAELPAAGCCRP